MAHWFAILTFQKKVCVLRSFIANVLLHMQKVTDFENWPISSEVMTKNLAAYFLDHSVGLYKHRNILIGSFSELHLIYYSGMIHHS